MAVCWCVGILVPGAQQDYRIASGVCAGGWRLEAGPLAMINIAPILNWTAKGYLLLTTTTTTTTTAAASAVITTYLLLQ